MRRWREKNLEHARALYQGYRANFTPEQLALEKARSKRYQEKHPDRVKATAERNQANRRALKRVDGEFISTQQWASIVEVFDKRCAYCCEPKKLGMDHFVPLASGGKHIISNLVPCCRNCNSSKKDRDPFEWMESRGIDSDLVVAQLCQTRHVNVAQERI